MPLAEISQIWIKAEPDRQMLLKQKQSGLNPQRKIPQKSCKKGLCPVVWKPVRPK